MEVACGTRLSFSTPPSPLLSLMISSLLWRNHNKERSNKSSTTINRLLQPLLRRPILPTQICRRAPSQTHLDIHHGSPPKGKHSQLSFLEITLELKILGFSAFFLSGNVIEPVNFQILKLHLKGRGCSWNVIKYFVYFVCKTGCS